jgi:DNA mismatch repair protein MutS2
VRIALVRLRPSATGHEPPAAGVTVRASTPVHAPDAIDVRGRSAHEAQEAVRALVDDAAIAGLRDVRVVHGRGTGVLKKAVRDELRRHPLVDAVEADAADGATIATLAT